MVNVVVQGISLCEVRAPLHGDPWPQHGAHKAPLPAWSGLADAERIVFIRLHDDAGIACPGVGTRAYGRPPGSRVTDLRDWAWPAIIYPFCIRVCSSGQGTLRPGAELSQVVLAERFGVSRIPIRDALRILAGEGLVEIEANRGAKAIALTPGEVREIYDLRVLLECDRLRRAAEKMTRATLDEIERARRKSDLDAGTPGWAAGEGRFTTRSTSPRAALARSR